MVSYHVVIDLEKPTVQDGTDETILQLFEPFKTADTLVGDWPEINPQQDYRNAKVEVYPVDMEQVVDTVSELGPLRSKYLGKGVVRLFRQEESRDESGDGDGDSATSVRDQTVVAILAVPSYFSPSDILGFVGVKCQEQVLHFRMIRTETANRYMVLVKFRDSTHSQEFIDEYNGKLFNSMEAETCQVVSISTVEFQSHVKQENDEIPYLVEDTFTTSSATTRPDPPPSGLLKELPTCPVCLERMDTSVTGLLTILCQHTFHCQCLSKWGDGSCPVCRYSQRSSNTKNSTETAACQVCKSTANPWVCVVCGNLGCGRYDSAHAFDHYKESGHCYSMDVQTQRVWDYASDAYVHRLVQNLDGKLVETGSSETSSDKKGHEEIALQYTHLLTSQLESQRSYYDDMLVAAADRTSASTARANLAEKKALELEEQLGIVKTRDDELVRREKQLANELDQFKQKNQQLQQIYTKLANTLKEEKVISQRMMSKLESVESDRDGLKNQVAELSDQVKDLMFYLDAQSKCEEAGEDVQQGQVIVGKKEGKKKRR